jgi:diaminohydroxyphosphoribosylaminopyrimidine deaminase/5-amino-6-(5-phosphoribosylamino)uracil reductase
MNDEDYMRRAFELARKGIALASPGALAGAVILKNGRVVGEGTYLYDGVDHAEVIALRQAGEAARGADVYTSLEPCSHFGRTPPCAQALIDAGVRRVVTAMEDPNPLVNGKGIDMLRSAGIEVVSGLLAAEAQQLNEAFVTQVREQRPFGILKIAMTLDGKIATPSGESRWITSEESRRAVQDIRHAVDAVVTGSGTFLKDTPQMTDRTALPRRRELQRFVLDRRGRVGAADGWTVFKGSLHALAGEFKRRQIQSFLLECGPDLAFNAVTAGIIDKIVVFIAPRLLGGPGVLAFGGAGVEKLAGAIPLHRWVVSSNHPDITITAYVHRNH